MVPIFCTILYFEKYCHMVALSRVSRVSRVRITVTVRIMVRFSFNGANLYIAVAPPTLHLFRNAIITQLNSTQLNEHLWMQV